MTLFQWLIKRLRSRNRPKQTKIPNDLMPNQILEQRQNETLTGDLESSVAFIEQLLGENEDFVTRRFHVFGQYPAAMFYFSNMLEQASINMEMLKPFMYLPPHLEGQTIEQNQLKDVLLKETLYHSKGSTESRLTSIIEAIMRGESVVLVDGLNEAFLVGSRSVEKRSIEQPATEQVIRGPREGFIEQLGTNISLMRYRLQTPNFRVETITLGRLTKTKVAVCFIKGIANDALVKEVKKRINSIDIDGILDSGYIEQFIEDNHLSPFPQVQNTERTDKAVANMLEGRVVILVDGSPFALIVPSVFNQFYQVTEDYSERFLLVSFIRLSRLVALLFSLITPSLYVAIISFNPELIPTEFAVAVAGGRAGVPFPSVIEVLIMEISMEVLREATVRLPQQVGGALSIVGVLVIGQAAVAAGFVSPITVVVIALTTIGSFATPAYNAALALRLLRFPLIVLGGVFGLYGVMLGLIVIANHVLSLKSFGVPYFSPIVPGNFQGMKDTLGRAPLWWMRKRPTFLHQPNSDRLSEDTVEEIKQPPSNTLDPLKVGNVKEDSSDGVPSPNNGHSGSGDSN